MCRAVSGSMREVVRVVREDGEKELISIDCQTDMTWVDHSEKRPASRTIAHTPKGKSLHTLHLLFAHLPVCMVVLFFLFVTRNKHEILPPILFCNIGTFLLYAAIVSFVACFVSGVLSFVLLDEVCV